MTKVHWPPKRGDPVRLDERIGKIIQIDRESEEVLVKWPGRKITTEFQEFDWQGHTCYTFMYRINGVLYHPNQFIGDAESLRPVTRALDSYAFDDLFGNWVSSEIEDGGYWELAA